MEGFRSERLGQLIREKIGSLILERKIKDPRVTPFISVTRVSVSRDLSFADIYISDIRENANLERSAQGLQSASGFIQSQLGASLSIRKIPFLRFHADTSIREGFDMIQKIEKLNNDNIN